MKMFFVEMIKPRNVFGDRVCHSSVLVELCYVYIRSDLGAVPENSKQYYGFTRFAIELNELDDDLRRQLPPTDTRFRPDQRFVDGSDQILLILLVFLISLLEAGQIDQAEKEKARIEQAQRSRSATGLCPKWFKQDGDSFVLIRDEDPTHNYWKKREEKWSAVEFLQLW
jgi:hypothetical protein